MLEKVLHRGKSRSSPDMVAKSVTILERLDQGNATDKQVRRTTPTSCKLLACALPLAAEAPMAPARRRTDAPEAGSQRSCRSMGRITIWIANSNLMAVFLQTSGGGGVQVAGGHEGNNVCRRRERGRQGSRGGDRLRGEHARSARGMAFANGHSCITSKCTPHTHASVDIRYTMLLSSHALKICINHVFGLIRQAIKLNFPMSAVSALPVLEFEARKDAAQLIGAIVRLDNSGDRPGERYVLENPQLLDLLLDGCGARCAAR